MGKHFSSPEALSRLDKLALQIPETPAPIPFSRQELEQKRDDYLLILGVNALWDRTQVTIRRLKALFGQDPERAEPCFYNQDWYDHEAFIDIPMQTGWFLIKKEVYDSSRAVQSDELMKAHAFPPAIRCVYAFFVAWYALGTQLWVHDFVWCSDTDHNGDRIYVGKYHDVDGVNKNGFSIHRHLALRPCYGCID